MRYIEKSQPEPRTLLEYRESGGDDASWDGFPGKDKVRELLLKDQGHLCCYCMRRIDISKMKAEHYRPRKGPNGSPERQLDWSNLLAACDKSRGMKRAQQTCDTRKSDDLITIDPQRKPHIEKLKFLPNGKLVYGREEEPYQSDINDRLNLNSKILVRNRKAALDAALNTLRIKLGKKSWSVQKLENELSVQRGSGKLPQYFGVFEKWLEKEIQRRRL